MNQGDARPPHTALKAVGWGFKLDLPSRPVLRRPVVSVGRLVGVRHDLGQYLGGARIAAGQLGTMGASLALVAASLVGYVHYRGTQAGRFIGLVALGMALGTLGDFFNADLLNKLVPLPDPVLGGMISFGLGHIAYIAACFEAARVLVFAIAASGISLLAWLIVATIGWYAIVYLAPNEKTRPLVFPASLFAPLGRDRGVCHGTGLADAFVHRNGDRRGPFLSQRHAVGHRAFSRLFAAFDRMGLAVVLARPDVHRLWRPCCLPFFVGQGEAPDVAPPQGGDRL